MRLAAGDSSSYSTRPTRPRRRSARAVAVGWDRPDLPPLLVTAHETGASPSPSEKRGRRFESCRGHMERRDRPNIDTVREVLQEENDRVSEEPPPRPTEEESPDADDERDEEA